MFYGSIDITSDSRLVLIARRSQLDLEVNASRRHASALAIASIYVVQLHAQMPPGKGANIEFLPWQDYAVH